jgi:hypothetical protein
MKLITKIKSLFMATLEYSPIPANDKSVALEAIARYKAQNPVKYAQKKEALFAKYGLNIEDEPVTEDAEDLELKEIAKKVSKAKK